DRLRSGVSTREFDAILDEILRIDDPFVSNRRIVTDTVTVGDRTLRAGDRVILNRTAANRDPRICGDSEQLEPETHAAHTTLTGIGKHVCPGRPLATLELRALTRAVLESTSRIEPDPERPPAGAWDNVSDRLLARRRSAL